jgi:hypothetical protein
MTVLSCVNYLKHYIKLMRKAEQRGWTKKSAPCYVEEHHIFPTSVFGENRRVVYLMAREHFIAHLLLWRAYRKKYGVQHWKTAKTAHAVWSMAGVTKNNAGRLPSAWQIAQARIASSEAKSGENHWTVKSGGHTPETKQKMSNTRKGRKLGPRTEAHKQKISIGRKGKNLGPRPTSVGEAISRAKKGVPLTLNHKDALSAARANIPTLLCEYCGKEIKGGKGNLTQHTRAHHSEK